MGVQNNRKIRAVPAYPGRLVPLEIFGLGNSTWDFLGFKFWSRDFFGFRFEALEICLADFCPNRSSLPLRFKTGVPPGGSNNTVNSHKILVKALVKSSGVEIGKTFNKR